MAAAFQEHLLRPSPGGGYLSYDWASEPAPPRTFARDDAPLGFLLAVTSLSPEKNVGPKTTFWEPEAPNAAWKGGGARKRRDHTLNKCFITSRSDRNDQLQQPRRPQRPDEEAEAAAALDKAAAAFTEPAIWSTTSAQSFVRNVANSCDRPRGQYGSNAPANNHIKCHFGGTWRNLRAGDVQFTW